MEKYVVIDVYLFQKGLEGNKYTELVNFNCHQSQFKVGLILKI